MTPGLAQGEPVASTTPARARVAEALRSSPVMFIENVGQFPAPTGGTGDPSACFQAPAARTGGWVIKCVDCPKQFWDMANRSLQMDASDWHIETVDSEGGDFTSLALDVNRYPHISYSGRGNLKYGHQDASGWHIETVGGGEVVGLYTFSGLNEDGYPHISFYGGHRDLMYAYKDAAGWHIETLDIWGDAGQYTSLALDEGGYPHISYHNWWDHTLKYVYQDASGWHIETVDSGEW